MLLPLKTALIKLPRLPQLPLPLRTLAMLGVLGLLSAAQQSPAQGNPYVFTFPATPVPSTAWSTVSGNAYTEDLYRIDLVPTNSAGLRMAGPASSAWTGGKAVYGYTQSSATVQMNLVHTAPIGPRGLYARPFTLKSMRLHPFTPGQAVDVIFQTYVPAQGGALNLSGSFTANTGSSLAGTVVQFPQNLFGRVAMVRWTMGPVTGGRNDHQFSEVAIETVHELTISPSLTVTENAGTASFDAVIEPVRNWDTPVSVSINSQGTATVGSDYTIPGGVNPVPLIIPAGQRSIRLDIPIVDNATPEAMENLDVVWAGQVSGVEVFALQPPVVVRIADNDGITNFTGWMAAHALTGNDALTDADPNRDGVSNLESWLCRLNPAGPNSDSWLARRASWHRTAANQPALRLTAPLPLPADVRLIFEETASLSGWTEQARRNGFGTGSAWSGPGASRITESSTVSSRTYTLPGSLTIPARPKAWFRLRYELFNPGGSN